MTADLDVTLKSLAWLLASAVVLAAGAVCGAGVSTAPSMGPTSLQVATQPPSFSEVAYPEVWSSNGFDG